MVKKKSIFPLTKLSDVVSMKSGESITAERITSEGKFPCFGGNGLRGYTTTFTHDGSYTLVGRQGALCGNVTFVSGRFYASEHAIVVTPKKETDIKFMSYVLYDMNLNQYSESSAQPGLSVKKLMELEYPIPQNKEEQTAIAEALSDIDSLISSLQKLIEKKKAIKQGAMQELLTGKKRLPGFSGEWSRFRLGEMTEIYSGGTPSTTISEYWGGSIPWMSSGELNNKKICNVVGRITQKGMQNSSAHLIPKYCVLIGLAGQGKTRGTAAYNYISLCTNQSIAAIYPNDKKFDSRFLYYIIDSGATRVAKSGEMNIILGTFLMVLACESVAFFIIGTLPILRLAISISALYSILGFSMAGFTFPVEAMHPAVQGLAAIFPLRHYYMIYVQEAIFAGGFGGWHTHAVCLMLFMLLPPLVSDRLKKAYIFRNYPRK